MRECFAHITAQALVPEQLVEYVTAVGQSRPVLCGACVAYDFGESRTLVAYKPGGSPGEDMEEVMNAAVAAATADGACASLTVLGPSRPRSAPANVVRHEDAYAFIPLPQAAPGQNLRHMLRRGARECAMSEEPWLPEHNSLVRSYLASRPLEAGTRHIFARIPDYLAASPGAVLFAARDGASRLRAFAVGDFSSLTTAFYMFAFRGSDCPPGVADVLLQAIVARARACGHRFVNLGLGVNRGIAAFKGKWGPTVSLPCVRTGWTPGARAAPRGKTRTADRPDALSAFVPPTPAQRLRRFFAGEKRPFDCLQVEITSRCAGKCAYCPHTSKSAVWRSRDMEDSVFAALAPLISRTKRVHLQGWGEPLLHPRFFDYALAAARAGAAVSTTTCGMGLNSETAEKFVRSGIDIVAFSLAGVDEKSNAARAGVPFDSACDGILALNRAKRRLGADRPRLHLAYLMLASGCGNVSGLPELMERLDAPVAVVSALDYIAAPGMEGEAYAPAEGEKIGKALAVLRAAAHRAAAAGRTIHYSLPGPAARKGCDERIEHCMFIDAEGNIAPCVYLNLPSAENDPRRRVFGNALEKNPMAVWNDPSYAHFRHRLAEGRPDAPCRNCAKRFERLL
ncbi:MAG: radical SAM protein [Desulfovibrio sp.]|jgi:MoaA/NifB/PqqE/SkfB family radical SAM enzyme|nr:radical SAM protein [Desulfovibrio sp.]